MAQQPALRRSTLILPEGPFHAISRGRRAWMFTSGGVIPLPSLLLRLPRVVSWLLRDHLRPVPTDTLAATVIPQMGCNAACGYCIQNLRITPNTVERVKADWMSDVTMAATAEFIERQRIAQGLNYVGLTIFGGEPLLNPERCYRLLQSIKHLNGASIITNGVLLTPEVAKSLNDLGVDSVQITFDGARPEHDKVRVLAANGGGTYDTIIGNLVGIDLLPVLPHRQLRVNVTRNNLDGLAALVQDLAVKLDPGRWTLYFALVDDNNIGWGNGLEADQSIDMALAKLARLAAGLGFRSSIPGGSDCSTCSKPLGEGGMVVNADGQLSSCWDTAGFPDMVVGNVWRGYQASDNADKWVQCGYRSLNQGPLRERNGGLDELAWTLRELAVSHSQRT